MQPQPSFRGALALLRVVGGAEEDFRTVAAADGPTGRNEVDRRETVRPRVSIRFAGRNDGLDTAARVNDGLETFAG
jgi:hypothetical protein